MADRVRAFGFFAAALALALYGCISPQPKPSTEGQRLIGAYSFQSRFFKGADEMPGWWGLLLFDGDRISKIFRSPDGKETRFYHGTVREEDGLFVITFVQAYKKDLVGMTFRNKMKVSDGMLQVTNPTSDFRESWKKIE